jgi:EmrB/QacA subfamily drug resistance transporter
MSTSNAQANAASGNENWVLLATILASSMAFIDTTALNVALPALQADLNVSGAQLLWIVNAYALFLSSLILVGGSLGDIYGRKRVFMAGIVLFTLSSAACGLAGSANVLIAARAVQGVGGALMVPGSLAILSALFAPERRGRAIGTWSMFSTLTTILGPVLGGWLAGQGLWRVVFFINLPLAAIALFVLATRVPESRNESAPKQLDFMGALLATLGLAGLTYGFIEAPAAGLSDPRILLTLGGGILALVVFVIVESRSDHPMVPLRLFKSRTFSGTNALTLFLYAALSGALFFVPLNLIQVQGYPEAVAGFTMLPFAILLTIISRWAGGWVDRIGARLPLIIGPAVAGIGFFLFAFPGLTAGPQDYWTSFFPAIFMLGVGMGITVAPLTTAVMGSAPAESSGTASGINNAVARTAGVLAVAILGAVALVSFSSSLDARTAYLDLSDSQGTELHAEASKLADAAPPADLSDEAAAGVETAVKLAFIDAFHLVAVIAAVMAWFSALLAALLVEGRAVSEKQKAVA